VDDEVGVAAVHDAMVLQNEAAAPAVQGAMHALQRDVTGRACYGVPALSIPPCDRKQGAEKMRSVPSQ
jgi:hypothetical protein